MPRPPAASPRPAPAATPTPPTPGSRGHHLTPSSGRAPITTNGTVISGLEITGTVTVAADNVTIKNSKIIATKGGSGTYARDPQQRRRQLHDRTHRGVGRPAKPPACESAVWNHYGNPGVVARSTTSTTAPTAGRAPASSKTTTWSSTPPTAARTTRTSTSAVRAVHVEHSTLFNTHHQTATVFGDTAGCGGNTFESPTACWPAAATRSTRRATRARRRDDEHHRQSVSRAVSTAPSTTSSTGGTYCYDQDG